MLTMLAGAVVRLVGAQPSTPIQREWKAQDPWEHGMHALLHFPAMETEIAMLHPRGMHFNASVGGEVVRRAFHHVVRAARVGAPWLG